MLRKNVVLSLFLTMACSSTAPQKKTSSQKNDFAVDWKKKSQDETLSLDQGIWSFFLFSREISKDRIPFLSQKHALLNASANLPLHGNPHPLSIVELNKKMHLDELEKSFIGPWWWDLLRIENGASALAEYNNFFNHKAGSCLDHYRKILSQHVLSPQRLQNNIFLQDNPLLPRNHKSAQFKFKLRSAKQTNNSEHNGLKKSLEKLFRQKFSLKIAEFKNIKLPHSPHETEAYRVKDEKGSFWLLQKISSNCKRFHSALLQYSPGRKLLCVQSKQSAYSLRKIRLKKEFKPTMNFIQSNYHLQRNLRAVCSRIAKAHIALWKDKKLKTVASLLNTNAQFYHYLLRLFEQEYKSISEAFKETL